MSKSKATLAREAEDKARAASVLRSLLKPGDTVYTSLVHVSRSGMFRVIKVIVVSDNQPHDVSRFVAELLDSKYDQRGGVAVGGGGMDMGFHVVYSLSRVLFADGFSCTGVEDGPNRCPANDHSNDYGEFSRTYDDQHAPKDPDRWYVAAESGFHLARLPLTDEQQEERGAYREAKSAAWGAGTAARFSPTRVHSDAGYALIHRWL